MLEDRIAQLRAQFAHSVTLEQRYQTIIALGRAAPRLDPEHRYANNLVAGCQSQMYLHAYIADDLVFFNAESDALIANGLAALLVSVYSGQAATVILQKPPTYLDELQIPSSLSPSRANGLASLHLRMKQEALRLLLKQKSTEIIHRGKNLQSLK